MDKIAANLGGTAAGIAREQRRTVLNDRHTPGAFLQLLYAVEHKQHLSVRNRRQAGTETAIITTLCFGFHLRFFTLPVNAEGRIRDHIVKFIAAERIIAQGITVFHAGCVAALDQHICLGDRISFGVELLSKAGQSGILSNILQALGQAAQHLRSAHGHIVGGLGAALGGDLLFLRCDQQLCHQVNNVPACEMGTSLLVIGFGEFPNQFLKNVAHVGGGDLIQRHIAFAGVELLQGDKQNAALDHQLDGVGKVEVLNDVLDIGGKALKIGFKVAFHIVRLSNQLGKIKIAGVVEVETGNTAEDTITGSTLNVLGIQFFCHFYNGRLGFAEGIIKTFQHGHGQNHLAVLMGLEQANQMGGNLPDQVGFCADIGIRLLLQFLHGHRFVPPDFLFFTF